MGRDAANGGIASERADRPKLFAGEELVKIGITEWFGLCLKHICHEGKQGPGQRAVAHV
jgi:hypothetical protein